MPTEVSEQEKAPRGKEKSISILLIEDNRLFRMGLSALLKKHEGLKLLASAEQPDRVPKLGRWQHPDVILLDLGLGDRGSLQSVRGIRETYPEARLIVMGLIPIESEILGLVKEGVSGFVLKDASISDFVASIRAVAAGQKVFPPSLTESLLAQIVEHATQSGMVEIADVRMTVREREIVDLIAAGLSNKEIGKRLSIATDTVKSHVHNILEKLSLRSRVEVAARARVRATAAH
ncbi:MAG TPA: response regulator transcription factor [Candidatus Eisenbacteria bacterium]|nr:response regulator transcription factor [Candidatus Eisenbacteria bacterium]